MRLLLVFTVALILIVPVQAYQLSLNEEKYGENLVRVYREAEILWVRDNIYILYDHMASKNKYVSKLSDEDITFILKNRNSRMKTKIDDADLTPYIKQVRAEKIPEPPKAESVFTSPRKEKNIEQPRNMNPRVACLRQRALTVFDPMWRSNKWVNMLSDSDIERILSKGLVTIC